MSIFKQIRFQKKKPKALHLRTNSIDQENYNFPTSSPIKRRSSKFRQRNYITSSHVITPRGKRHSKSLIPNKGKDKFRRINVRNSTVQRKMAKSSQFVKLEGGIESLFQRRSSRSLRVHHRNSNLSLNTGRSRNKSPSRGKISRKTI